VTCIASSKGSWGTGSWNDLERPEWATQRCRARADEDPTKRRSVTVTLAGLSGPSHTDPRSIVRLILGSYSRSWSSRAMKRSDSKSAKARNLARTLPTRMAPARSTLLSHGPDRHATLGGFVQRPLSIDEAAAQSSNRQPQDRPRRSPLGNPQARQVEARGRLRAGRLAARRDTNMQAARFGVTSNASINANSPLLRALTRRERHLSPELSGVCLAEPRRRECRVDVHDRAERRR